MFFKDLIKNYNIDIMVDLLLLNGIFIGNVLTLPLDFLKTQMQIQNNAKMPSFFKRYIGVEALMLKSWMQIYINNCLYSYLGKDNKIGLVIGSSIIIPILTPLDHILTKLQTTTLDKNANKMNNIYQTVKYIISTHGTKGLFRGIEANFFKNFTFLTSSLASDIPMLPYYNIF